MHTLFDVLHALTSYSDVMYKITYEIVYTLFDVLHVLMNYSNVMYKITYARTHTLFDALHVLKNYSNVMDKITYVIMYTLFNGTYNKITGFFPLKDMQTPPPSEMTPSFFYCIWCAMF